MKKHRRRLSSFRRQQTLGEFTLRQQRSSRHRRAEQRDRLRVLVPLLVALMLLSLVMIAGILLNAILPGKDYEFGSDQKGDTSVNFKV